MLSHLLKNDLVTLLQFLTQLTFLSFLLQCCQEFCNSVCECGCHFWTPWGLCPLVFVVCEAVWRDHKDILNDQWRTGTVSHHLLWHMTGPGLTSLFCFFILVQRANWDISSMLISSSVHLHTNLDVAKLVVKLVAVLKLLAQGLVDVYLFLPLTSFLGWNKGNFINAYFCYEAEARLWKHLMEIARLQECIECFRLMLKM